MSILICRECGLELSESEFYLTGRGRLDCTCKTCRKTQSKERYDKNPYRAWAIHTRYYHESQGVQVRLSLDELEHIARIHDRCMLCQEDIHYGRKSSGAKQDNSPVLDKITLDNFIDTNNCMVVCPRCNGAKKGKTLKQFIDYCRKIILRYG